MESDIILRRICDETVFDLIDDVLGLNDDRVLEAVEQEVAAGGRKIVLNLSRVPHLSDYGMANCIKAFVSVQNNGGQLKLVVPSPEQREFFRVTRLDTVLEIFVNEAEARATFKRDERAADTNASVQVS